MAGILGILTIASFIAALVLNSQAVTFVRNRLSFHMNTYIEIEGSIDVMDKIQGDYKCCGENLWLDWSRAALGSTGTITNTGTGTGTGINTGTGTVISSGTGSNTITGTGTLTGRRRRNVEPILSSPLVQAVRQRRQLVNSGGTIYNLPSTYTINLPLSCCKNRGVTSANTVGGCKYYFVNNLCMKYISIYRLCFQCW